MTSGAESDERRNLLVRRLVIGAGLLGCVAIGLVFPFTTEGRLWGELFDLAHAPVFCGVLLLIVGMCDPPAVGLSRHTVLFSMTADRVLGLVLVLIAAGGAAEVLQAMVGRSASLGDIAANSIGLIAGVCWIARCRSVPISAGRKYALAGFAVVILVSISPLMDVWDCVLQIRSFPMLASFERPREFHNWKSHGARLTQSSEWATDGNFCGRLDLQPGSYPGMLMIWFARDWTEKSGLHLALKNPGKFDLQIVVKLHDQQHVANGFPDNDRYHEVVLVPAEKEIAVDIPLTEVKNAPETRPMDLDQMWTIDLFAIHLEQPAVLLVDEVRLK